MLGNVTGSRDSLSDADTLYQLSRFLGKRGKYDDF